MKQCPKCQANISDTAKFCMQCGYNIKKYEEEHTQPKTVFCPECGTKISGGSFCPECGFNINGTSSFSNDIDSFGDDWLEDIESSTDAAVKKTKESNVHQQREKAFAAFEYDEHADGTYTIIGLKDTNALQYFVPEKVVAIADHAFQDCEAIEITLPDTILRIGNSAFKGCCNLTNINLPKSLMIVGDEAFAECEMLDISLPATVRKVGRDALKDTVRDKKVKAETEAQRKAEETRKAELAKWNIGGTPTFGSYYQSGRKQPIEWTVLKREGSKALLISKYMLDNYPYNTEPIDTTWETSTLRTWLNDEFLKEAFTATEQQRIIKTKVSTRDDPISNAKGGNPTYDKIFLLSKDEADLHFISNDERKTTYASSKPYNLGWWLRSPAARDGVRNGAWIVDDKGHANAQALRVDVPLGVRPALWIEIDD